ncbi:hypothetical protein [Ferrovum sp. PN-J185]|uniref:hypothetical protein n=1 Tax=Ferrovum sp. PN-J185 TaxID=1356306 RepID=UPI000797249E|nr:hypothetical protein [Ferrovum sp. PN-J185]KXW55832.1 hypothetical protein FV185_09920 [Ferrovum sp. PN-J185]
MSLSRIFDISSFIHEQGYCWIADLPVEVPLGELEGSSKKSTLRLFENGVEMGPSSALHSQIREIGLGAYSHWGKDLYFSSSNNTNPSKKKYQITIEDPCLFLEVDSAIASENNIDTPINYLQSSYDPSRIDSDAKYAIRIADTYVTALPEGRKSLYGKSVLELGPGNSFATVLILKALGAKSIGVADRFLAKFDSLYHPVLYKKIAELLKVKYADADLEIFYQVSDVGHATNIVDSYEVPLEKLREVIKNVDLTLSNAVLEHLYDPFAGAISLYDIMAPYGIGLHQVDFRDHRDFSRPLEYLMLGDQEFKNLFYKCNGECGGKTRPFQMSRMFSLAGFEKVDFYPNMFVDPTYLDDFFNRLKRLPWNLYGYFDKTLLMPISGQFRLRKRFLDK